MRYILHVLLPIVLIGCEPERKVGDGVVDKKSIDGESTRDEASGEAKRKARVQELVRKLADKSPVEKDVVYADLRDVYVRKRDIPDLVNAIEKTENHEVKNRLEKLISFMNGKWRLPNGGWTNDLYLCGIAYEKEFGKLGCDIVLGDPPSGHVPKGDSILHMLDGPPEGRLRTGVFDLILMLEPEILYLPPGWSDIEFTKPLINLKELRLDDGVSAVPISP